MKKFLMAFCAVAVCLSTCVGFAACSSDRVTYGKYYELTRVEFMGFSGNRTDIQEYLEAVSIGNETNDFYRYLDIATRISIIFDKDEEGYGVGKLKIREISSIEGIEGGGEDENLKNFYDQLVANNMIDEKGNAFLDFDYSQNGTKITISTIHTKIPEFGSENGDISLADLLEYLCNNTGMTVANKDESMVTIKNGKVYITVTISVITQMEGTDPIKPDIYTDLTMVLGA